LTTQTTHAPSFRLSSVCEKFAERALKHREGSSPDPEAFELQVSELADYLLAAQDEWLDEHFNERSWRLSIMEDHRLSETILRYLSRSN
jgi:hypothetical protein